MQNINPHAEHGFCERFEKSDLYTQLVDEYGDVVGEWGDFWVKWDTVPRELFQGTYKRVSYIAFYYIEYLLKTNPKVIADIGCGHNWFKRYIPNVVGYDNFHKNADVQENFDANFINNHYEEFEAAFSINALHFISIDNLGNMLLDFAKIIKPGGRAFLTFNSKRMVEQTPINVLYKVTGMHKGIEYPVDKVHEFLYQQVIGTGLNLKILEFNDVKDEWMDGNCRVVFEK